MTTSAPAAKFRLPRNVIALGLVSLLNDSASEMAFPLLPVFITSVLGGSVAMLGWIEGVGEFVANVLKLYVGRIADRVGRNRPFVVAGYTLSSIAKPLLGFAAAPWHVLAVRVSDRVGKGLRTSPRDALLSASVDAAHHASAFGFHRAMDHLGAVIGPLAAVAMLTFWTRDLRLIFFVAAIPCALTVLAILFGVREAPRVHAAAAPEISLVDAKITGADRWKLLRLIVPASVFALGNSSDAFLLLKAGQGRDALTTLPLLWMGLHVVKAFATWRGGMLADRIGRVRAMAAGWLIYIAVYIGFAFATSAPAVWTLFAVYGLYYGFTEGAERALVSRLSDPAARATAFGWYNLAIGTATLAASVMCGALWDAFGPRAAFLTGAGLAAAGLVLLLVMNPER